MSETYCLQLQQQNPLLWQWEETESMHLSFTRAKVLMTVSVSTNPCSVWLTTLTIDY